MLQRHAWNCGLALALGLVFSDAARADAPPPSGRFQAEVPVRGEPMGVEFDFAAAHQPWLETVGTARIVDTGEEVLLANFGTDDSMVGAFVPATWGVFSQGDEGRCPEALYLFGTDPYVLVIEHRIVDTTHQCVMSRRQSFAVRKIGPTSLEDFLVDQWVVRLRGAEGLQVFGSTVFRRGETYFLGSSDSYGAASFTISADGGHIEGVGFGEIKSCGGYRQFKFSCDFGDADRCEAPIIKISGDQQVRCEERLSLPRLRQ